MKKPVAVGVAHGVAMLLLSPVAGFHVPLLSPHACRSSTVQMLNGYYSERDVILIERKDADVKRFHDKERQRWLDVYEEVYNEVPQDFYPGDRVEVVADVKVKDIESTKGMTGVVTHFEFDDGYEACQSCTTTTPVTVLLDEN